MCKHVTPMQIAAYPAELNSEITQALLAAGVATKLIHDPDQLRGHDEWPAILIDATSDADRNVREANRVALDTAIPVVVVIDPRDLAAITGATEVADFILSPLSAAELTIRLNRVATIPERSETLVHRDLLLNTATYQATLDEVPLDLTFMEYELLRYLVEHPGRVWSREQLLSSVWGYDYFGGARTVDVHVRRLRAKLGEERASWISTVRSVGYRFG